MSHGTFSLIASSGTVYLRQPNWSGEDKQLSRDIDTFDFWDGTFDTVDKGLSAESLDISGVEYITHSESVVTGYFDSYDESESEWGYPYQIVDGDEETYGLTDTVGNIELLNSNTIGKSLNKISKVEVRVLCRKLLEATPEAVIQLTPIHDSNNGTAHTHALTNSTFAYSPWFDITSDIQHWSWCDINTMELELELLSASGLALQRMTLVAKIEIRVTQLTTTLSKFSTLNTIMNNNEEVTIEGLIDCDGGDCYDGVYVIRSFSYNTIKGTNKALEWKMQLEHVRDL